MAIIKQVELDGTSYNIGAEFDIDEDEIKSSYAANLTIPVGGTTLQLLAKDNTILTTLNLEVDASTITSGILPVARGGTGANSLTANAVLTGNGTNAISPIASSSGAFFATSSGGIPGFDTLPIAQGGTGVTTLGNSNNSILYLDTTNNRIASFGPNVNATIRYLTQTNGGSLTWSELPNDIATSSDISALASTYATQLVKGLIGNTQEEENGTLILKSGTGGTLSSVTIADATYVKHGLMSSSDKQKLDEFYLANAYATTAYVDQLISEQTDITAYKGVVSFDSTDNRWESDDGTVWPPASPQNGWTYKVGTQGTPTGMSETCYVGDFLIYSTSGGAHWARIGGSNSEGSLYKKSPYTAGEMLLADDNLGAVKSVDIAPTVTLGTPSASTGQTITISVGGQPGTLQQSATLGQATTSVYGVTKLTSTDLKDSANAQSLAVTPAGVYNILRNDVVAPITNAYTLLPATSSDTPNNTDTFKWEYDSTNDYYYVTIQSPHITENSYEFVTTATSENTSLEELAALQNAAIVTTPQSRTSGAGYGTFSLIAMGTVPSITTHIRITHNYSSAELDAAETTAAAYASAAETAAASAHNMIHRAVTFSSTTTDTTNAAYPNKYVISWNGVGVNDWMDATGVTDQDWMIELAANQVILRFTDPIASSTTMHLYWAPCNEYSV